MRCFVLPTENSGYECSPHRLHRVEMNMQIPSTSTIHSPPTIVYSDSYGYPSIDLFGLCSGSPSHWIERLIEQPKALLIRELHRRFTFISGFWKAS